MRTDEMRAKWIAGVKRNTELHKENERLRAQLETLVIENRRLKSGADPARIGADRQPEAQERGKESGRIPDIPDFRTPPGMRERMVEEPWKETLECPI